jgi:hypothetical protein
MQIRFMQIILRFDAAFQTYETGEASLITNCKCRAHCTGTLIAGGALEGGGGANHRPEVASLGFILFI